MKKSDLKNRTHSQLMSLAAQAEIVGRSRMKKAQLIAALSKRRKPTARRQSGGTMRRTRPQRPAELPAQYGKTRLTLMEIDPYRVHAFWEVTPADHKAAIKRIGRESSPPFWILRFHDVKESEESTPRTHFDVPVDLTAGNWYVNLPADGRSYRAELGPCTAHGRFDSVCGSNTVHVPAAQASPQYHPEWLQVEGEVESMRRVSEPESESPILPSTELTITVLSGRSALVKSSPLSASTMLPAENQDPSPTDSGDAEYWRESEWPPQLESSLECFDSLAVGSWAQGGATPESASEVNPQLHTEVIVRGRTHQGQALWVNGEPVEINPDGTFYLRWALPARSE